MSTGSSFRKGRRKFRNALYKRLEAEIRGAREDPNCGSIDDADGGPTDPVDYPFPILWFEEMTPVDLDLYHANCKKFEGDCNKIGAGYPSSTIDNSRQDFSMDSTSPTIQGAATGITSSDRRHGMSQVHFTTKCAPLKRIFSATAGADETGHDDSSSHDDNGQVSHPGPQSTPKALCKTSHPEEQKSRSSAPHLEKVAATAFPNLKLCPTTPSTPQITVDLAHASSKQGPVGRILLPAPACPHQTQQSQATESIISLPGLPSQALITQHGEDPWYNMEDEAGSQLSSEHSVRSTRSSYALEHSQNMGPGRDTTNVSPSVRLFTERKTPSSGVKGREARARLYHTFTQALERSTSCKDGQAAAKEEILRDARHRGFVMIPREDVLPHGVPGGQGGVIPLLESRLARVREKVPDGYVARALELACHVLRQPRVCVRVSPEDGNVSGGYGSQAGSAREAYDDHAQVVGVAEVVWEILRTSSNRVEYK